MAIGPDGLLYVSSRFEGRVYRVFDDGTYEVMASDLGVACGLAFGADGTLYVGDRSGTVFRVDHKGRTEVFASVPASVRSTLGKHQDEDGALAQGCCASGLLCIRTSVQPAW